MKKKFDEWNKVKIKLDSKYPSKGYFHEREIWWCHLGLNVGHEQDGKGDTFTRPVLIIRKFGNELCLVLPLSTRVLRGEYFFPLLSESNIIRVALFHHIKSIDSRRLMTVMDHISIQEFEFVKEKITILFR